MPDEDPLERAIAGALRDAINAHGPITSAWIGSAVKRIIGNLRNAKVTAHARALGQRRWRDVAPDKAARVRKKGGKSAWTGWTKAEISAEMKRRRQKGLVKP